MINRIAKYLSEPALYSIPPPPSGAATELVAVAQRPRQTQRRDDVPAATEKLERVIVPLDGSLFAEHAIAVARGLAEQSGASLQLLHVADAKDLVPAFDAMQVPLSTVETHIWRMHQYLSEIVGRVSQSSSIDVSAKIVRARGAAEYLCNAYRPHRDLVVMATHGRGALGRLWRPSVSHALLRQTRAPLILVPATHREASLDAAGVDHFVMAVADPDKAMPAIETILRCDFLREARHALLRIVRMGVRDDLRQCFTRPEQTSPPRWWIEALRDLYPLARKLRRQGRDVHSKVIRSHDPVGKVIVDCALQTKTDLIVVPFQPRPAMDRLLRPSTAEYLFRNSDTPVMFVPEGGRR